MSETIWMKKPNGKPEKFEVSRGRGDAGKLLRQGYRPCAAPAGAALPPKPASTKHEGD